MNEFSSRRGGGGAVVQSSVPKRRSGSTTERANGLHLRGVVVATYVIDDPNHPRGALTSPVAVYCDVLCFSNHPGARTRMIRQALVAQTRGSMHSGKVWKPRAATIDITGKNLDPSKGNHPGDLDGEHVLIGFLNDNLHEPVIISSLPHPSADVGNENKDPGNRLRLKVADGDPDFWKHHGAFYGVDDDGSFLVDTRQANDGSVDASGNEPVPPTDGSGSQRYRLSQDAEHEITLWDMSAPSSPTVVMRVKATKDDWTISFEEGATIKVEKKDSNATLTLGDGAVHAAIYDALEMFWNQTLVPKFTAYDAHVHGSAVGPTGPPTPPLQFPALETAIKSSKLLIPDG